MVGTEALSTPGCSEEPGAGGVWMKVPEGRGAPGRALCSLLLRLWCGQQPGPSPEPRVPLSLGVGAGLPTAPSRPRSQFCVWGWGWWGKPPSLQSFVTSDLTPDQEPGCWRENLAPGIPPIPVCGDLIGCCPPWTTGPPHPAQGPHQPEHQLTHSAGAAGSAGPRGRRTPPGRACRAVSARDNDALRGRPVGRSSRPRTPWCVLGAS